MLSKKIFLSATLMSMAGFVACGDDSSSNSGDDKLPEKVETIEQANDLKCDESVKCAKVFVEEELVNDYFQCDGAQWFPATDAKFKDLCPAEEEQKGEEGTEEGSEEGGNGSDDNGNKSEGSEGSENTGDNGSSTEAGSSASSAESTSSNADSASSGEGSEGSEELTGPTGDLYSCLQDSEIDMFGESMKTKICTETTANSETAEGLKATCVSSDVEGFKITSTEGTGCSAETGYVKKCVVSNDAAVYFYDADAAGKSCEDLLKNNN